MTLKQKPNLYDEPLPNFGKYRIGRLGAPMSEHIPEVEQKPEVQASGLGHALMPQWLTVAATVLVSLAGIVAGLPAMGVALPPAVVGVASALVAIGVSLGIASPGLRKKE